MSKYIKFTGDYSKLKSMGYMFQKLYAHNYQQWCKDGIRIWRKGSDITCDEYNLYQILELLENNPNQDWTPDHDLKIVRVYYRDDNGIRNSYLLSHPDGFQMAKDWFWTFGDDGGGEKEREKIPEAYTAMIPYQVFDVIDELTKLGWWEFADSDNER